MLEVDEKIAIVRKLGKKKRRAFIESTTVPVVISPHGEMYIVDHHHFLCVCYHAGIKKVRVSVVRDLSSSRMSYERFWRWMFHTRNAYPYCQFGEGPRKALYLPRDIRGLADDPYRSIAWFVRKAGGFDNSDRNFAEFKWANFFRSHRLLDRYGPRAMPRALLAAAKLAQSAAAKDLPGFEALAPKKEARVAKKLMRKGAELQREAA